MTNNQNKSRPEIPEISSEIINKCIDNHDDDFTLELEVYQELYDRDFTCSHGGTYQDSNKNIARQYDIRAEIYNNLQNWILKLAVECKSFKNNLPILISRIPRKEEECYHEVLLSKKAISLNEFIFTERITGGSSYYKKGNPVGKKANILQDNGNRGFQLGPDKDVYEKYGQAVQSAHGLIEDSVRACEKYANNATVMVLPILILRDATLWTVDYNEDGSRNEPKQENECTYFLGKDYIFNRGRNLADTYSISHLHICTVSGFKSFLNCFQNHQPQIWEHLFCPTASKIRRVKISYM